jgi:hypothetical protein
MDFRKLFARYGFPALLALVLLLVLQPTLSSYMGFAGQYAADVAAFVVFVVAQFVFNKTVKYVE